jgi:GT2 family glycosyltransferase
VIVPAPTSPAVSIIVALHNCLHLTQAMLRSLDATWPADVTRELILVDDASSDGTRAWLAALPPIPQRRFIHVAQNVGYAAANNLGARDATGQRLLFLNNDLEFHPGWLEPLLRAHARLGDTAGVTGASVCVVIDDAGGDEFGQARADTDSGNAVAPTAISAKPA